MDKMTEQTFNDYCYGMEDVFFIQIGANDGRSGDPLYKAISENNWKGICIEPGNRAFEELQETYKGNPNVMLEKIAISDKDGEMKFYKGETSRHFTLVKSKAEAMFNGKYRTETIPTLCMNSLIEKYNIEKVNVLQIDAEGYDLHILKTFPFDKFKPSIVRFEYVNLSYAGHSRRVAIQFMQELGYGTAICNGDIIAILP